MGKVFKQIQDAQVEAARTPPKRKHRRASALTAAGCRLRARGSADEPDVPVRDVGGDEGQQADTLIGQRGSVGRGQRADRPKLEDRRASLTQDLPRPGHPAVDQERADRLVLADLDPGDLLGDDRPGPVVVRQQQVLVVVQEARRRGGLGIGARRRPGGRTARGRARRGTSSGAAAVDRRPRAGGSARTRPGRRSRWPDRTRGDSEARDHRDRGRRPAARRARPRSTCEATGPLRPHRARGGTWMSVTLARIACSSASRSRSGQVSSR